MDGLGDREAPTAVLGTASGTDKPVPTTMEGSPTVSCYPPNHVSGTLSSFFEASELESRASSFVITPHGTHTSGLRDI